MNLANNLARVQNAITAQHPNVILPATKLNNSLVKILWEEGYITRYKYKSSKELKVDFKYFQGKNAIQEIRIISKPSRRFYLKFKEIKQLQSQNIATIVVSTSQGLLTSYQACELGIGGEILCIIF